MFSEKQFLFLSNFLDGYQNQAFVQFCEKEKINKIGYFLFSPPMNADNVFETSREIDRFFAIANPLVATDFTNILLKLDTFIDQGKESVSRFYEINSDEYQAKIDEAFNSTDFSFEKDLSSFSSKKYSAYQNTKHEAVRDKATFIKKMQLTSYSLISIITILSFVRLGASI